MRILYLFLYVLSCLSMICLILLIFQLVFAGELSPYIEMLTAGIPIIYGYLVWNIFIWYKNDKSPVTLILMLFFHGWSNLVYPVKVLKKGWI